MGCCLALGLMISFLRRLWFALVPWSEPTSVSFAPPARRPAPGLQPSAPTRAASLPSTHPRVAVASLALGAIAASAAGYAVQIQLLVRSGMAVPMEVPTKLFAARDVVIALVIAAALTGAAKFHRAGAAVPNSGPGVVMVAAGATWFLLGALDMHAADGFVLAGGSLTADLVFHAAGLWVAAAGATLLSVRRGAAPRLGRLGVAA